MYKYTVGVFGAIITCVTVLLVIFNKAVAADTNHTLSPCSTYLYSDRFHHAEWTAKLEVGVLRRQVVGFDLGLTFLFNENTLKVSQMNVNVSHLFIFKLNLLFFHFFSLSSGQVEGRPVINIELNGDSEYVAANIYNEQKVKFFVRYIFPGNASLPRLAKIELDSDTVCQENRGKHKPTLIPAVAAKLYQQNSTNT